MLKLVVFAALLCTGSAHAVKEWPEPMTTPEPDAPAFSKDFLYNVDLQGNLADKLQVLQESATTGMDSIATITGDGVTAVGAVKAWLAEVAVPTGLAAVIVFGIYLFFSAVFQVFGTILTSKGTILAALVAWLQDANTAVFTKLLPNSDVGEMMDRIAKNMDGPQLHEILTLANQVYEALEKYDQLKRMEEMEVLRQ